MSAWYIAMWVKAPLPVMSPSAHRPGARRASARRPATARRRRDPDGPGAQRGEVGAPAGADEEPRAREFAAADRRVKRPDHVLTAPRRRSGPPALGRHPGQRSAASGSSRVAAGRRLDHCHPAPEAREDLGELQPTAPPPSTSSDSGTVRLDGLAVGPVRRPGEAG